MGASINRKFLLSQGEGRDEWIVKLESFACFDPLTLTLQNPYGFYLRTLCVPQALPTLRYGRIKYDLHLESLMSFIKYFLNPVVSGSARKLATASLSRGERGLIEVSL